MLEVCLALLLSTILVGVCSQFMASSFLSMHRVLARDEAVAMWQNMNRVMAEDVHGSKSAVVFAGTLYLTEADGTQYHYLLNGAGQFVRVRTGGGTAVLAAGLGSVDMTATTTDVTLLAAFRDGFTTSTHYASLVGMTS